MPRLQNTVAAECRSHGYGSGAERIFPPREDRARFAVQQQGNALLPVRDGEIIIVLNKVDLVKKPKLLLTLQELSTLGFENIVPISAKTGENADSLVDMILKYLPESQTKNFLYDEDYYTDKSLKFMVSEIVREKALYFLN